MSEWAYWRDNGCTGESGCGGESMGVLESEWAYWRVSGCIGE